MKKIIFIILIIVIFSPIAVLAAWNCQHDSLDITLGSFEGPQAKYNCNTVCFSFNNYSCVEGPIVPPHEISPLPEPDSPSAQSNQTSNLINPLTGKHDVPNTDLLIGQIIKGILGIVGSLALIMFIYGGFIWMTAAGNKEAVTKGKNILIWAFLGLIIIFTSYALVEFILVNVLQ